MTVRVAGTGIDRRSTDRNAGSIREQLNVTFVVIWNVQAIQFGCGQVNCRAIEAIESEFHFKCLQCTRNDISVIVIWMNLIADDELSCCCFIVVTNAKRFQFSRSRMTGLTLHCTDYNTLCIWLQGRGHLFAGLLLCFETSNIWPSHPINDPRELPFTIIQSAWDKGIRGCRRRYPINLTAEGA